MLLYNVKCPYCKTVNQVDVSIIEENNHPLTDKYIIEKSYFTCGGCMEDFKIELKIIVKAIKQ
jgi:hypothetical protein